MGVFQNSRLFRWFGLIVAVAANITSWRAYNAPFNTPFLNGVWIARFLSACALLVSSGFLFRMKNREGYILAPIFFLLGAVMWFAAFGNEFWHQGYRLESAFFVLVSLSALLFTLIGKALNWRLPQLSAILPLAYAISLFLPFIFTFFVSVYTFLNGFIFSYKYTGVIFLPPKYLWTDWRWLGWLAFAVTYAALSYAYRSSYGRLIDFLRTSLSGINKKNV